MLFGSWFGKRKYTSPQRRSEPQMQQADDYLRADIAFNLKEIQRIFSKTPDLTIRHFVIKQTGEQAILFYLNGLTDKNSINNNVLRPLQQTTDSVDPRYGFALPVGHMEALARFGQIEATILHGSSVLLVGERKEAYSLDTAGWPQRAIEDPQLETSLKGAHQGFVETASQNIAMIRRYIPNRELKTSLLTVGKRGHTKISIMYLDDVAHPEVLKELEDRIKQIDTDVVINTGELAEYIEDNPFSPFPQFLMTERPDAAVSQILQGRFVVVVDHSPSVLIAPVSFTSFFQSVDDYSTRWSIATFIRMLRMFAFFIAIFLPAIYIAVISYNFELIPIKLLLSIGEFRGRVPFPPFVEAIIMELTLEMMREAGVRLPAPVGQTVGIVGGIVIGQAIVQAGFISNTMVIVVAFTAIASFILPNYDMVAAVRLIRFAMMVAAAMFGIVGIVIGLMTMVGHLIALESLGTPYGSPYAPMRWGDWKDAMVRVPLWLMNKRPTGTRAVQLDRQGSSRPKGDDK